MLKDLNLFQRINLVMSGVSSVHKGATVSITRDSSYKAVSHDDVTALLHSPIQQAGLVAIPTMEEALVEQITGEKTYNGQTTKTTSYLVKVWASVTFVNIDRPEERITTKCYAYALDSGDKATGKAYSMAVKYCYLKAFMLESSDEEESRDYEKGSYSYGKPDGGYKDTPAPKPVAVSPANAGAPASDAQKGALKKMGIPFNENISKSEASDLIKNANNKR